MDLLNLNAAIHIDTSELDVAIEKVNQLLSLLQEAKKAVDSLEKGKEKAPLEAKKGRHENGKEINSEDPDG